MAELRRPGQSYAEVSPVAGAPERLKSLRAAGHYVILFTARHMKTCEGNTSLVVARQGLVTLRWLEEHGIEFDEIMFGKPHADVYIDDNALRFTNWDEISGDGSSLPRSHEDVAGQI